MLDTGTIIEPVRRGATPRRPLDYPCRLRHQPLTHGMLVMHPWLAINQTTPSTLMTSLPFQTDTSKNDHNIRKREARQGEPDPVEPAVGRGGA